MPRTATHRRSLTKETVNRIKARTSKFVVWDSATPNFGLRVYPTGSKSYVLRLSFTNSDGETVQRMETVGDAADFPDPEAARKAALELRQRYKAGEDVRATRATLKSRDVTLRQAMEMYLEARASGTKPMKESTAADYRAKLGFGMAQFMDNPLVKLDAETVIRWHRQRKLEAPTRADGEARYLRAVWNWTREELPSLELPEWPTGRWSKQKEWSPPVRRKRRLSRETAPLWMDNTRRWPNPRDRALFLLLYFTGWRISEAMNLRWSDVDLDQARVWLRDTKARETHQLPLSRQAVAALNGLPSDTEWVFPAPLKDGGVGPMVLPSKAVVRHRKQSGVEWSAHDLRRGFISIGEAIGVPSAAVRRLTGHVVNQRDAHDGYIDFDADDLAPHAQRVSDALEAMTAGNGEILRIPVMRAYA